MRFLSTSELFDAIYDLSSRSRNAVYVAVAFVGKDSYELFDENIREVKEVKFVVNLSENSVRSGSTNPAGVAQLQHFAQVRSREDLHAKVFIFDKTALVGSANLSKNATSNLEAGVLVDERSKVNEILSFFKSLWKEATFVDSRLINNRLRLWAEGKRTRTKHGSEETPDVFPRPAARKLKHWETEIPAPRSEVPAIVFAVGRIT